MALDWEKIGPNTPLSALTVGDLLDVVGWALSHYKAAEQGDVSGFAFTGYKPILPTLGSNWDTWQSRSWAKKPSAGGAPRIPR